VQAESAATSRQITGEEVTRVPTSTRSFTALLSTEAGVSTDLSPVAQTATATNRRRSTERARPRRVFILTALTRRTFRATKVLCPTISRPAPETLQEVKLQTSLYDASTGRSGGGNFQLVTRSGGNEFRGSAYYYLQNKKLTANEFFFQEEGIEKPRTDRNEAGLHLAVRLSKTNSFSLAVINIRKP
jgi:hypothetical protein